MTAENELKIAMEDPSQPEIIVLRRRRAFGETLPGREQSYPPMRHCAMVGVGTLSKFLA